MEESCGKFGKKTLTCSAVARERITGPASAPSARDRRVGPLHVQVNPRRGVENITCV